LPIYGIGRTESAPHGFAIRGARSFASPVHGYVVARAEARAPGTSSGCAEKRRCAGTGRRPGVLHRAVDSFRRGHSRNRSPGLSLMDFTGNIYYSGSARVVTATRPRPRHRPVAPLPNVPEEQALRFFEWIFSQVQLDFSAYR